jgi:uncharacterized protein YgiM (DUF1202 family)
MKRTPNMIASSIMAFIFLMGLLGCAELQKWVSTDLKGDRSSSQVHRTERVTAHRLNLRQGPSTKATILAVLKKGDSLEIQREKGVWLNVITEEGTVGWVYSRYVTGYGSPKKDKEAEEQISSKTSEYSSGRQGPLIQPDSKDRGEEKEEKRVAESEKEASAVPPVKSAKTVSTQPSPVDSTAVTSQDDVKNEPLFEDEPVAGAAQRTQTAPSLEDSDPLFEDDEPIQGTGYPETGRIDPASHPKPEPPTFKNKGPWGNAKLGTRIKYRVWKTVGTFDVKRIPVSITEEVIAVEDQTVVVKARREWRENGDLKSDEKQLKKPRFVSSEELKIWMAKHGEETGTEVFQIGDQPVECDIYTVVEEKEIKTSSGETKKISLTKISHLSKSVPGWRVRLEVKSEQGDEIKWCLLDFKP